MCQRGREWPRANTTEQLTLPPSRRRRLKLSGSGGLSQEPGLELILAINPFYCTQILAGNCLTPFIWGSLLSRVWATARRRDQSLLLLRRVPPPTHSGRLPCTEPRTRWPVCQNPRSVMAMCAQLTLDPSWVTTES